MASPRETHGWLENAAGLRGNIHEPVAGIARQQHRFAVAQVGKVQFDGVEIVALRDQQIFPSVVVIVEKAHSPARVSQRHLADSGGGTDIGE